MNADTASPAASMDRIYRYQRYFYDATRKYFLLGRDRLLTDLGVPEGGTILEIGCGTGRNLIHAAKRYPAAKLFGLDVSRVMLETAERSVARAGLADRITLREADATHFDAEQLFSISHFDRVFISYAISMIPVWRDVLPRAADAIAPRGALLIVDFGQQEDLPAAFRSVLFAWLSRFHVTPRADLEAELCKVATASELDLAFTRLYRGYANYAVLRRP